MKSTDLVALTRKDPMPVVCVQEWRKKERKKERKKDRQIDRERDRKKERKDPMSFVCVEN